MIGDPILIVSDKQKQEKFHLVLQEHPDFNVTLCGIEVVVEDRDYYLNFDRDLLLSDTLCWECCEAFGRQGRQKSKWER